MGKPKLRVRLPRDAYRLFALSQLHGDKFLPLLRENLDIFLEENLPNREDNYLREHIKAELRSLLELWLSNAGQTGMLYISFSQTMAVFADKQLSWNRKRYLQYAEVLDIQSDQTRIIYLYVVFEHPIL